MADAQGGNPQVAQNNNRNEEEVDDERSKSLKSNGEPLDQTKHRRETVCLTIELLVLMTMEI